jgi:molybdenum-dependent DNA-binding transcriptional regulator ModE
MIENERPETILTPAQEKALLCLLQAGSIREASKQAEISEAQIYRYLKEPAFMTAYRQARRAGLEVAIRKLETLTGEAIDTLQDAMKHPRENEIQSQRLQVYASKTILEFALRIPETDILERIEALEERR